MRFRPSSMITFPHPPINLLSFPRPLSARRLKEAEVAIFGITAAVLASLFNH